MILYQDNLLALEYEISTDILTVHWPDLSLASLPELQLAITKLIDAVHHYDVKKLLIDSSRSNVEISDELYKPVVFGLIQALTKTRLLKMARVSPENTSRELRLRTYKAEMASRNMYTFKTEEFATLETARRWLVQKD